MKLYASSDDLFADLMAAAKADTANPVAAYVVSYEGKPRGLIAKYQRCPKLKIETYSKEKPIWTGSVDVDGEPVQLSSVIEQLIALS